MATKVPVGLPEQGPRFPLSELWHRFVFRLELLLLLSLESLEPLESLLFSLELLLLSFESLEPLLLPLSLLSLSQSSLLLLSLLALSMDSSLLPLGQFWPTPLSHDPWGVQKDNEGLVHAW